MAKPTKSAAISATNRFLLAEAHSLYEALRARGQYRDAFAALSMIETYARHAEPEDVIHILKSGDEGGEEQGGAGFGVAGNPDPHYVVLNVIARLHDEDKLGYEVALDARRFVRMLDGDALKRAMHIGATDDGCFIMQWRILSGSGGFVSAKIGTDGFSLSNLDWCDYGSGGKDGSGSPVMTIPNAAIAINYLYGSEDTSQP